MNSKIETQRNELKLLKEREKKLNTDCQELEDKRASLSSFETEATKL